MFPTKKSQVIKNLINFSAKELSKYSNKRNYDLGPPHKNVSKLSPYLRTRFITEEEVLKIAVSNNNKDLISKKIKAYIICWSVIPSLWSGLILIFDHDITIIFLALCFIIVQLADELIIKYFKFPLWYLFLRRSLTIIVIFTLIFSYFLIRKF